MFNDDFRQMPYDNDIDINITNQNVNTNTNSNPTTVKKTSIYYKT